MNNIETRIKYLRERIETLRSKESEYNALNAEGYDWAIDDVIEILDELEHRQ